MCNFVNCLYAITRMMDEDVEVVIFCTRHDCGPEDCPSSCRPEWVDGVNGFEKAANWKAAMPKLVYCKHGLIECTCGVCMKHKFSVAVKGGHVIGSTTSNSIVVNTTGCCQNPKQRNYHW